MTKTKKKGARKASPGTSNAKLIQRVKSQSSNDVAAEAWLEEKRAGPGRPKGPPKRTTHIYLPSELKMAAKIQATKEEKSLSSLIEALLASYLAAR